MAPEEQGRPTGVGDQIGQRAHFFRGMSSCRMCYTILSILDCKDRFFGRRDRIRRPRRSQSLLLFGPRPESSGFLAHLTTLQDKANMIWCVCVTLLRYNGNRIWFEVRVDQAVAGPKSLEHSIILDVIH